MYYNTLYYGLLVDDIIDSNVIIFELISYQLGQPSKRKFNIVRVKFTFTRLTQLMTKLTHCLSAVGWLFLLIFIVFDFTLYVQPYRLNIINHSACLISYNTFCIIEKSQTQGV